MVLLTAIFSSLSELQFCLALVFSWLLRLGKLWGGTATRRKARAPRGCRAETPRQSSVLGCPPPQGYQTPRKAQPEQGVLNWKAPTGITEYSQLEGTREDHPGQPLALHTTIPKSQGRCTFITLINQCKSRILLLHISTWCRCNAGPCLGFPLLSSPWAAQSSPL